MGRAWRIEYKGALYHLMSRGNDGQDIFHNDEDRNLFFGTALIPRLFKPQFSNYFEQATKFSAYFNEAGNSGQNMKICQLAMKDANLLIKRTQYSQN